MSARLEIRQYNGGGRHSHDHVQVLFPMRGAMRLAVEGCVDVVANHSVAVIPRESEHDFSPSADCRLLVLDVEEAAFARGRLRGDASIVTPVEPWLWRLFSLLGSEVEADRRRADDAACLALTGLQLLASRTASPLPAPSDRRILETTDALGNGDASISALARRAGLGQSQFHALFRATTGQSPKQFRLRKLLDRAVDRLLMTNDPISEIAYGLGYQNVSSFNRLFRRRFGVTPSEFRATGHRER